MTRPKEELLQELSDCVFDMEEDLVADVAREYLEAGYPAIDGIMHGLVDGLNRAGEAFDEEDYFVTDLLLCSDAMYAGLDVLKPHLPATDDVHSQPACVIGVAAGDTHDIGKNLVKIMMEAAGFRMYDLGRDVPVDTFIDKAVEVDAKLICMSALLSTTMVSMPELVKKLDERGLHGKIKVMVGGGPVTQKFADDIGADGYSVNATQAVALAKRLTAQNQDA